MDIILIRGWSGFVALTWLSLCIFSATSTISTLDLQSWKLCKNGPTQRDVFRNVRCSGVEEEDGMGECDERTIKSSDCKEGQIRIGPDETKLLKEALEQFDDDKRMRRLTVFYPVSEYGILTKEIDIWMTPRPLYSISQETFPWQYQQHSAAHAMNRSSMLSHTGRNSTGLHISIDKYRQEYEEYLRLFPATQYPHDPKDCYNAILMVTRSKFIHPGWAGVLDMLFLEHEYYSMGITALYVSESNWGNDTTAFISGDECVGTANRWECAFLPTTSCRIPDSVTTCTAEHCVDEAEETDHFGLYFYQNKFIPKADKDTKLSKLRDTLRLHPNTAVKRFQKVAGKVMHFRYVLPPQVRALNGSEYKTQVFNLMHIGERPMLFVEQYLLRMNAFYRSQVAKTIWTNDKRVGHGKVHGHHSNSIMHMSPQSSPATALSAGNVNSIAAAPDASRCIAAHIRRGDRLAVSPDSNMTDYCLKNPDEGSDFGCTTKAPFYTISLDRVLDVAAHLVQGKEEEVKTVFVATDDSVWLSQEILRLKRNRRYARWTVVTLPSGYTQPSDTKDRKPDVDINSPENEIFAARRGTQAGVHLMATMQLMRRCEGFIGHFASGATWMLYRAMCHRHHTLVDGGREAVCPPSFDMRQGFDWLNEVQQPLNTTLH